MIPIAFLIVIGVRHVLQERARARVHRSCHAGPRRRRHGQRAAGASRRGAGFADRVDRGGAEYRSRRLEREAGDAGGRTASQSSQAQGNAGWCRSSTDTCPPCTYTGHSARTRN